MLWHTFNQPLGVMAAAVSLCGGGVLERFRVSRSRYWRRKATARGRPG